MRRTYAYNSIYFGLLFGAAIGAVTKSVVLGIVSGIIITVIFFMLIRAMENAISKKTDKFVSSITRKLDEKHLKNVQTQQVVSNVQTQQAVNNVQSQQPVNDVKTQQSAITKVIDCEWVCQKCGTKLDEECLFCPNCGNAVANDSGQQLTEQNVMVTQGSLNEKNVSNELYKDSSGNTCNLKNTNSHKAILIISVVLSSITLMGNLHCWRMFRVDPYPVNRAIGVSFIIGSVIFLISLIKSNIVIRLLSYFVIALSNILYVYCFIWNYGNYINLHDWAEYMEYLLTAIICIIFFVWTIKTDLKKLVLIDICVALTLVAIIILALFWVFFVQGTTWDLLFMEYNWYYLYLLHPCCHIPLLLAGLLVNNVITLDYRKH